MKLRGHEYFARLFARLFACSGPPWPGRSLATDDAQRLLTDARREAAGIIAEAQAQRDAIIAEVRATLAFHQAAVAAAQDALSQINSHIVQAKNTYRRLEADVAALAPRDAETSGRASPF